MDAHASTYDIGPQELGRRFTQHARVSTQLHLFRPIAPGGSFNVKPSDVTRYQGGSVHHMNQLSIVVLLGPPSTYFVVILQVLQSFIYGWLTSLAMSCHIVFVTGDRTQVSMVAFSCSMSVALSSVMLKDLNVEVHRT